MKTLTLTCLLLFTTTAIISQPCITAPVASTPQTLCVGATVANLTAQGANIKWYDAASDGTELANTDALDNGITYYATQSSDDCESTARTAVTVILQSNMVLGAPDILSHQALCLAATLADIAIPSAINPNNIVWYDASTGGNLLPVTTPIPAGGGTFYAALTAGGSCESAARTAVEITVTTTPPGSPTISPSTQSFCTGATIANIAVPHNQILWYDADAPGGNLMPASTILNAGIYYAAISTGSCQSTTRTPVTIQINNTTLPAPTGPANQTIFGGGTLANLQITGSSIIWYSTANIPLPINTPLELGTTTYYAAQSTGSCESSDRLAITVTVIEGFNAPSATTPQTLCSGATISNLVAKGLNINWYDSGNNLLAATTPLIDGETYFAAQSSGSCESTLRTAVTVIIKDMILPAPAILPNPQNLCGPATVADIIIPTGINNVVWYDKSTGGTKFSSTNPLTTGTYYAAIRVGNCESTTRTAVVINVVPSTVPGAPSSIIQSQYFCQGATVSDIVVPNNQIAIFATSTSDTPLMPETVLTSSTYYAKQMAGTCESMERTPITVNVGTPSAPVAPSPQIFCLSATVANLAATGAGLVWYDSNTSIYPLDLGEPLATGEYFVGSSICDGPRTKVDVAVLTDGLLPPSATTPQVFCSGAFVYNLQAQGVGIKWYSLPTGGTALLTGDALTSAIYYAAQSTDLCESTNRTAVNVVIDNTLTLDPPAIISPQRLCPIATLADVAIPTGINPANVVWYAIGTGGTSLDPATVISASSTYYAATKAGSCESLGRTAVAITIGSTPPAVPIIESPQGFCLGAMISNIVVPNNQIRWYATLTGGSQLASNTILTTRTYYATQGAGGCESGPRLPIQIKLISLDFCGGDGSSGDPYLICNASQLDFVRYCLDKHFKLNNDIDIDDGTLVLDANGWLPIGTSSLPFTGSFNGDGHKITGLWINQSTSFDATGLFGVVKNATIQNLGFELAAAGIIGKDNVGGLTGSQEGGTIDNCYVSGYIEGNEYIGGLVGFQNSSSIINNCYTSGTVKGNDNVGGLVGMEYSGSITDCYSVANVYGNKFVGGLVGHLVSGNINNCYATGLVAGYESVGGFVGDNGNPINNCYATGAVSGNENVGGFTGRNNNTINNCYATGAVSGNNYTAGFAGINSSSINNCFFDTETTRQSVGINAGIFTGVTGLNTSMMQIQNIYADASWDFTTVWGIYEGYGYPYLRAFNNDILVTPTGGSKVFDAAPAPTPIAFSIVSDNPLVDLTLPITVYLDYSGLDSKFTDVGTYTIIKNTIKSDSYQISFKNDVGYIITAVPITVTAIGGSSNFGESPTNPGISFSGLPQNFDESLLAGLYNDFSITSDTPAGSYILYVEGDFSDLNYSLSRNSGIWVVKQLPGYFENLPVFRVIYSPTLTLADVILPEGYKWNSPGILLKPGNNQIFAVTYTDPSGNYTTVNGTIQVNVRKARGAAVSGPPTLTGLATESSIEVNILTIPDNPGNQTVVYAISTNGALLDAPTLASLSELSWQSGTTFTGVFSENTSYYIYARSASNTYYSSGPAQVSAAINVGDFTGIVETGRAPSLLTAYINDGVLYVSGLTPGKPWRIYNILGTLIYQGIANNIVETRHATSLQIGRGIYIVLSEGEAVKIRN